MIAMQKIDGHPRGPTSRWRSLWKCECLLHLLEHHPWIQDRERDNADDAEHQRGDRDGQTGRDDNV